MNRLDIELEQDEADALYELLDSVIRNWTPRGDWIHKPDMTDNEIIERTMDEAATSPELAMANKVLRGLGWGTPDEMEWEDIRREDDTVPRWRRWRRPDSRIMIER